MSVAELVTSKLMPQRFSDRRTYKGVDKSRAHPLYFPLLTKLDLEIRVIQGVNFFGVWQKLGATPERRLRPKYPCIIPVYNIILGFRHTGQRRVV